MYCRELFGSLVLGSRPTKIIVAKSGGGFKMSGDDGAAAAAAAEEKLHCASCGKAEIDDIKLKDCNSCDLVRYCSDDCEENHKSEHEEACKKRAAELRDELLFKQPESTHLGDCPICMLPLPLDESKFMVRPCCCNFICMGCMYKSDKVAMEQGRPYPECPYCREPTLTGENNVELMRGKLFQRAKVRDPEAMCHVGHYQYNKGDYSGACEWYAKAADLGHAEAHYHLACSYHRGEGVEKDSRKEIHHLEEAATGGHPKARYALAFSDKDGGAERRVRHLIIASNQGCEESMKCLVRMFKSLGVCSVFSKEDLAAALRGHQAALKAAKSPLREEADAFRKRHM